MEIVPKIIAFPFAIDSSGNVNFVSSETSRNSIRVKSALGTIRGERVMRPEFGSELAKLAFQNEGSLNKSVESYVKNAFMNWLPDLTVKAVEVGNLSFDGSIQVNVTYTTPLKDSVTTTAGVVVLSNNNPSNEVTL